jgi:pimeloyl-ACP methyl ester carboxylesterase
MRHDQEQGDFVLRADPRHKRVNPVLYRHEEVMACWRRITARMLAVIGGDSSFLGRYEESGVLEQLAGMVDDFESAVIADSGHMVHHEQPEDLAAAIIGWLET